VNKVHSKSARLGRAALRLALPIVAVIFALGVYGYRGLSTKDSQHGIGVVKANEWEARGTRANHELEAVKRLNRDFLAALDRNMADRHGKGYKINQALAYDTMMAMQKDQAELTDAGARKYLGELNALVNRYYDQLVRFNSEQADLAKLNGQISGEIERIQQDASLSDEEKYSRKRDLKNSYFDASQKYSITSRDLDETVKLLRNLSVPAATE